MLYELSLTKGLNPHLVDRKQHRALTSACCLIRITAFYFQAWAHVEAGLHRALASYCVDRWRVTRKTRPPHFVRENLLLYTSDRWYEVSKGHGMHTSIACTILIQEPGVFTVWTGKVVIRCSSLSPSSAPKCRLVGRLRFAGGGGAVSSL